jgi:hypothetical protein
MSINSTLSPNDEIEPYRKVFFDNSVDSAIIDILIRQTKQWSRAGIHVYAFRPPTTHNMIQLENELSGFDEKNFKIRFANAGGTWLDVNQTAYVSYDGSHLHRDAALQFSLDLAEILNVYESQSSSPRLAGFPLPYKP